MTRQLFLSIPFVFHIPWTIGCSYSHFSISSLISGLDRLEVINSAVLQALLRAARKRSKVLFEWMLTRLLLPTAAVRLLYQISNHGLNYNKHTNTSLWSFNMVISGNCHFENKTVILSVKFGTISYFVEWVATLSLNIAVTLHKLQCYVIIRVNSGKCITVFVRKKHSSQRARRPKLLHIPWLCLHWAQEKRNNFPS